MEILSLLSGLTYVQRLGEVGDTASKQKTVAKMPSVVA